MSNDENIEIMRKRIQNMYTINISKNCEKMIIIVIMT